MPGSCAPPSQPCGTGSRSHQAAYSLHRILAAGDGPVGWFAAVTSSFNQILTATAHPEFLDEFFGDPANRLAGGIAGHGTATPDGHAYLVEGEWSYCTGCHDATWLGGLCTTPEGNTLLAMVPAERADTRPSWDVTGLRGTAATRSSCPASTSPRPGPWHSPTRPTGRRPPPTQSRWRAEVRGRPRSRAPPPNSASPAAPSTSSPDSPPTKSDHLTEIPWPRTPPSPPSSPRHEATWLTADTACRSVLDDIWHDALAGQPPDRQLRLRARLIATHACAVGADIARYASDLAGISAIERTHPLARCQRDGTILPYHHAVATQALQHLGHLMLDDTSTDSPVL